MEGTEPRPERVDELDTLIERFAESGYAADGAEVPHERLLHVDHDHDGGRRVQYRGHEIEILTHYEITIDGERWDGRVTPRLDGTVTYHGLPQYAAPSAVELMEAVIDTTYEAPEPVRAAIEAAREDR